VPSPVHATSLAARHIREAEEWWRDNRSAAPNAFRLEIQRAFALIAEQPRIGSVAMNVRLPGVRRIYLPKIRYHRYYHLIGSSDRVEVIALWHAQRGEGPPV
jgi:plasmid stabilization system protein ParE